MRKIRFLHISKTGGTTLASYIAAASKRHPELDIRKFHHRTTFRDVCESEPDATIVFFVREPMSRFASGFHSRKREGRPSHYRPWRWRERFTFTRFDTPNDLAEALSSANPWRRLCAIFGMNSIYHIKRTYRAALADIAYLEAHKHRIGFILQQEHYDADFAAMIDILGLDPDISLPQETEKTHRAPSGEDRRLSEKARANLTRWYADDYPVYQWCLDRRAAILAGRKTV